jgi:cation-transporting ATPase E
MQAERIGEESYVNNLVKTARAYKFNRTPLERQLDILLKWLILIMVVLAPLTLLNGLVRGVPLPESVENVVNLISSLVPQGLIVFVAISFAYGVIQISRYKALIQRPNAIESMGHVTCLCADKTGTLTRNELSVKEIIPLHLETLDSVRQKLGVYTRAISWQNRTVAAIAAAVPKLDQAPIKKSEVPFNSERKWSGVSLDTGTTLLLGAPELLLTDPADLASAQRLSRQGLRIVVLAESTGTIQPGNAAIPEKRTSLALIALQDQLRENVCETLNDFASQGVAIKIISGDSAETVTAITRQACMDATRVLTGMEIDRMEEAQLDQAVRSADLFARINPQAKRRIISSLAKGAYIAMIGDGVNDVPALKQAHIAIAMNDGAQIAKDVADITLLNNAFSTLPRAFREGRELTQRIYGIARVNLQKVVYLTLLFVLTGFIGYAWPATLIETTWLSFITLNGPALLIIFRILPVPEGENEPQSLMRYLLTWGVIGAVMLVLLQIVVQTGLQENLALSRTMVIVFAGIFNCVVLWDIYGVSPFSPRSFLVHWQSTLAGVILAALVALIPVYLLTSTLGFERLDGVHWLILFAGLALAYIAIYFVQSRPAAARKALDTILPAAKAVAPDSPGHLEDKRSHNGDGQS